MKGRLVACWGPGNCGKSSSIKHVYELLVQKYVKAKTDKIEINADIKALVRIESTLIGLESQGDPNTRLQDSLVEFAALGCNIIVCATRTSGMTVEAVKRLSEKYDIIWMEKKRESVEARQDESNMTAAKGILAEIE